jgi:hypothetical protein
MVRRAVAAVLVLAACSPGFESKSIVIDLRMLGLRADPPEIVEDFDPANPILPEVPPVTVTALLADPGADRRLGWRMVACPPDRMRRCDGGSDTVAMGEGVADDPEQEGAVPIAATLEATADLLIAAFEGDQNLGFGGLQVMVELSVWPEGAPDEAIVGAKMIIYAPRIPAGRTANANPTMDAILVDEMDEWAEGAECREITTGTEIRLEPVEPEGVRETYLLPTLDGGQRIITENLRYAWFATVGSFSADQTGGTIDFFGNPPPLHTRWTAPDEASDATLWLVQRDERGGTSWTQRCFAVVSP